MNKGSIPPIEKFPLRPRADGRWQKRINNQIYYFHGTRKEARDAYDAVKHDLYAGREPAPPVDPATMTLGRIGNLFLDEKEADRDAGRISRGWYDDCASAIRRFMAFRPPGATLKFKSLLWSNLRKSDLAAYARHLHGKLGVHAYNRERSVLAAMFNLAEEEGWTAHAIRLGRRFPKRAQGEARTLRRDWLLDVATIRALLAHAGPQFRAMILLGLNCGFGPGDCAALEWRYVDLNSGRIRFPRPKNKIQRDCPLWPETVKALKALRAQRPDDTLVFRNRLGRAWNGNSIAQQFWILCAAAEFTLPHGVGMNAPRHTCATYANEVQDTDAYKRIMGRKIASGIDETYVDAVFLPRLKKIVDHVHRRLKISKSVPARPSYKPAVA